MEQSSLKKPHLIIMVGIPGSGKSFFAEHFAETFKAPIVSFDHLRQKLFKTPTFSKDEDEIINQASNYLLSEIQKTGRTIVFEGQTDLRSDRAAIAKQAHDANYEPLFIWVQTEQVTAQKRAMKKNKDKPSLSLFQFNTKLKQFSPPHQNEKAIVISGKHTYASQLRIVLKQLIEPRSPANKPINTAPIRNRNRLIR